MQTESRLQPTAKADIPEEWGWSIESFIAAFSAKIVTLHGKTLETASNREKYLALADWTRDTLSRQLVNTTELYRKNSSKQVYYLSLEFLPGRLLSANLQNLGLYDLCVQGLKQLGISLSELADQEEDPALGNGGLGRLAACYLDSMASLGLPGHGCGLRYRYGLFEQRIADGYQLEFPDNWLKEGRNEWEYRRPEETIKVRFGGHVDIKANGRLHFNHQDYDQVSAVPYDIPIPGNANGVVNTLRLWSAEVDVTHRVCTFTSSTAACGNVITDKHAIEALQIRYTPMIHRMKARFSA